MIAQTFAYYAPSSVGAACTLLAQYGDHMRVLAGGQELVPAMTAGEVSPGAILDLRAIASLNGLSRRDGNLLIGSMVTHRRLERDPLARECCGLLAETAAAIGGGIQVRNRGTIGGGICRGSNAGDYLASVVALDAKLRLISVVGERTVSASDFFLAPLQTAARPDELLTEIIVPELSPQSGYAYYKLTFSDGCYNIASAACILTPGEDGTCNEVRLALGGVARRPLRLQTVEAALTGNAITPEALDRAAELACAAVEEPISDVQADGAYRQTVAGVVVKRAIQAALARCGRGR
jgi:carbon-monoxide dehydrogenase medium subunit